MADTSSPPGTFHPHPQEQSSDHLFFLVVAGGQEFLFREHSSSFQKLVLFDLPCLFLTNFEIAIFHFFSISLVIVSLTGRGHSHVSGHLLPDGHDPIQ